MGIFDFAAGLIDPILNVAKTGWDIFAQNKTWDREDTAVQRRVADLKAAGLSPTLAAGSAASTSSPINIGAPTPVADYMRIKEAASNLLRMKQDIATSNSQEVVNHMQAKTMAMEAAANEKLSRMRTGDGTDVATGMGIAKYETLQAGRDLAQARAREAFAQAMKAEYDADLAAWDLKKIKEGGTASHLPGGFGGVFAGASQQGHSLAEYTRSHLQRKAAGRQ